VRIPKSLGLTGIPATTALMSRLPLNSQKAIKKKAKINQQIASVSYGLPNVFNILHSLGNYKFIVQLDIVSAFHAIPIHPEDRKYPGFQVGSKCYQFCRVPFGLKTKSIHIPKSD
jgi:hypothetical protein